MLKKDQNKYAEIVVTCIEEKLFKAEAIWEHHSLLRILAGEMKVVQADRTYTFYAGDSLLFQRNQVSTLIKRPRDGQPYKSILVTFTSDRLNNYYAGNAVRKQVASRQKIRQLDRHPLLESYFASLAPYYDLQGPIPERIIAIKIEEALTILRTLDEGVDELLADFSEPGKINLAEFMEQHYRFNMPLERFGYLTGRSLATFNRDFRKIFHTSPQKWIMQRRLELANYEMAEKQKRSSDIYLETGFENLSHFSYAFKKYFGYAPSELPGRSPASD